MGEENHYGRFGGKLCVDIYQVATRSCQVFAQVFVCNYQLEGQVTEAQHISRGYDEAANLLTKPFPTCLLAKGKVVPGGGGDYSSAHLENMHLQIKQQERNSLLAK